MERLVPIDVIKLVLPSTLEFSPRRGEEKKGKKKTTGGREREGELRLGENPASNTPLFYYPQGTNLSERGRRGEKKKSARGKGWGGWGRKKGTADALWSSRRQTFARFIFREKREKKNYEKREKEGRGGGKGDPPIRSFA